MSRGRSIRNRSRYRVTLFRGEPQFDEKRPVYQLVGLISVGPNDGRLIRFVPGGTYFMMYGGRYRCELITEKVEAAIIAARATQEAA